MTLTPREALDVAAVLDACDDADIIRAHEVRLRTRAQYSETRIARSAAIELCIARGHPVKIRGCAQCVADITKEITP